MKDFGKISEIDPLEPISWQNKFFLTFDVDWAHDEILSDTLDLVEQAGVSATFFMTHETPLIERIYENKNLEMGIHPNFNFLLQGDHRKGRNIGEVISKLLNVIPNCKSVRSHSITQSGPISDAFRNVGITHESNDYIPESSGIGLKPWLAANKMIKVPYNWADEHSFNNSNVHDLRSDVSINNLNVFDFHPIHVFLNTNQFEQYDNTRTLHRSPNELIKFRSEMQGTRDYLKNLITF